MNRIILCLVVAAGAAFCQTPTFEVTSVKPAAPVTGHFQFHMTSRIDAGRVEFINASLTDLIRTAYRVNPYQVEGPAWLATEKFDVLAKLPEGAHENQAPDMLQALLAERFKLTIHRATKELSAYAMVARKGGPKLKESPEGSAAGNWSRSMGPEGSMHMEARNLTATALAQLVASFLGYPVVDLTDLTGTYDVPLDFSAEDLRTGAKVVGVTMPEDTGSSSSGSMISASLQQVGLRLESRKLPVDIIVIDHLEKTPTSN